MKRILVTDGMAKSGVEALKAKGFEVVEQHFEPEELQEQVKEFDAVVVRSATKVREPIIDGALETKKLKLIVRGGVGLDNIDVAYAEEKGIAVRNTPSASSASVAELAIAHMFSLSRFLYASNVTMREGQWNKKQYSKGIELTGKTLGLIGFGRIFVLLSTRGRKTGKKRFTPLEYHRIDGVIHVFSSRGEKADWYRNMLARPDDVEVLVGFRRRQAKVEVINNFAQFKDLMRWYVTKHPRLAKSFLGWNAKKDDPEKADFSKIAKLLRIVRVHETPKES